MDCNNFLMIKKRKNKIDSISNKEIKENVKWAVDNIPGKNIIVYAPNASGKTTLSNIISDESAHFHSKYVEYIDDDKSPNIVLFAKAKKFSYKDSNSYQKIITDSIKIGPDKYSLKDVVNMLENSFNWYQGSASYGECEFLISLNDSIIEKAKANFDQKLIGRIPKTTYYELEYRVRPYSYINANFENTKDDFIKSMKLADHNGHFNGDGDYINNLIDDAKGNQKVINGIYLLVLLVFQFRNEINRLIELNLGIKITSKGTPIQGVEYEEKALKSITEQLIKLDIINSNTIVTQTNNNKIIFRKNDRNITRTIFSKISDGQANLLSLIFFIELNLFNDENIVFDDPFDALDRKNSYQVLKIIKRFEKKKTITILTHDINSFEMMKQHLGPKWMIMFLKNKILFELKELENMDRKFLHTYINGDFASGIILLFRYLKNESKLNDFLYSEQSKNTIVSLLGKYHLSAEPIPPNYQIFYRNILKCYDMLAEIKVYIFKNYKDIVIIKKQIKSGVFTPGEDEFLCSYEKLYFVINDLSHNNSWGYNFIEILSFEKEIKSLYDIVISK